MREEWRQYWREGGKHAKQSLLFWPLVFAAFFTLLNYVSNPDPLKLRTYVIYSVAYAYLIPGMLYILYMLAWAGITVFRSRSGYAATGKMVFHLALSAMGVALGILAAETLSAWILGRELRMRPGVFQSIVVAGLITLVFLFYTAYLNMRAHYDQLALSTSEARYHTLKAQLQPHFLFNSLNSLAELMHSSRSTASEMTQKLADLYREILENSKLKTASLESELSIVEKYLELERLRFGERLHFSLVAPKECGAIFLPTLLLQTLVENAVKHGISQSIEGGKIELAIQSESGGWYRARLVNTGACYRPPETRGTGLTNTISRLDLFYGDRHQFQIAALPDGSTEVQFSFTGGRLS